MPRVIATILRLDSVGIAVLLIAIVAVAAGLYGRFKGLGFSPLAMDEYFIVRSVQNVLERGLPEWACGGWYSRGLLYQYSVAPMLWAGIAPEVAVRIPAVLASLAGLPAVYLLTRRLGGTTAALTALALVAISLWEIEMARFGRMYAPFQTVFLWFLYFAHAATVDGDRRAQALLLPLSLVGVLIWEGGLFLLALNFLPLIWNAPRARYDRSDALYVAAAALLLLLGPIMHLIDTRDIGELPAIPPGLPLWDVQYPGVQPLFAALLHQPVWLLPALAPIAVAIGAWAEVRRQHSSPPVYLALGAGIGLLLLHQFVLFGMLAVLLVLAGWLSLRDFSPRDAPWLWALALVCAVFWALFGLLTHGWLNGQEHGLAMRAQLIFAAFVKHPRVLQTIVQPWIEAVPALAAWSALLLAVSLVAALVFPIVRNNGLRLLVAQLIALLAAIAFADPYWQETRYSFFLYPAVIIAGVAAVALFLERWIRHPAAARFATMALVAVPFLATEDFNMRHLRTIDSPETTFRSGYSWPLVRHFYQRFDYRGAGEWLQERTRQQDLVLATVSGFDFYYPGVDYMYRSSRYPDFAIESCQLGQVHRWSNLPQIYDSERVIAEIESTRGSVWLVTTRDAFWMNTVFDRYGRKLEWTGPDGHLQVWHVRGAP